MLLKLSNKIKYSVYKYSIMSLEKFHTESYLLLHVGRGHLRYWLPSWHSEQAWIKHSETHLPQCHTAA